jgi:hypothetical protein
VQVGPPGALGPSDVSNETAYYSDEDELVLPDNLPVQPFPQPLEQLLLPASALAASAAGLSPAGAKPAQSIKLEEVVRRVLPGNAQKLAEVRVSTLCPLVPVIGC